MSTPRRWLTIVLALLGAAGFAIAAQGGRWWDVGPDVHLGLTATERCFGTDCAYGSLAWSGGTDTWERLGVATYAGALVAALALLAVGGAVAARRQGRLAAAVAMVATITTVAVGVGFVVTRPALEHATVGRGLIGFAVAVVAAVIALGSVFTAKR